MDTAQDFVNLFVDSTGELLYFIAIFVCYQAVLLMALDQSRRSSREQAARRYAVSVGLAQIAWLTLMGGALYSVTEDSTNLMPPLENAVRAVVLVCLSWGLLTAEHEGSTRRLTIFSLLVIVLLFIGFVYTLQNWNPDQDFNTQDFSVTWAFIPALLAGTSILLLLTQFKHVADIPLKLLFFALIIVGHVYALVELANNNLEGDAAGPIRWAYITSSALIVVLVYRVIIDRMTEAIEEVATYAESISKPQKAITTTSSEMEDLGIKVTDVTPGTGALGGRNLSMELLKALGIMLDKEETNILPRQIVASVGGMLKADIVAIIAYDESSWADILAAHNFIQDIAISGMSLNLNEQPTLRNAIQTKQQMHLSMDENSDELQDLYTRLDITQIGPTYIQPLNRHGNVVGVLIVGLPYTRRDLRQDECRLLESMGPIAARLLVISRTAMIDRVRAEERAILQIVESTEGEDIVENTAVLAVRREMQESLELAQREINELTLTINNLQEELDRERDRLSTLIGDSDDEAMSITQRIEAIVDERETLQHERQQLANALKEAQATLAGVTPTDEAYQAMIQNMQHEINELHAQKRRLEEQLADVRQQPADTPAVERLRTMLQTISEEKARIAAERDQVADQLKKAQSRLDGIGIEDNVESLMQRIAKLTEERTYYQSQAERATQDREMLLRERQNLEDAIAQETERATKLQALEDEVARLTYDREALAKSRDSMKAEREALIAEREGWHTDRARMLAHNDSLKMELDETLDMLSEANRDRQELSNERNQIAIERDILRAQLTRAENERDTLLARIEGDRERLQELGAEGIEPLTEMIDNLSKERVNLEQRTLELQQQVETLQREISRLETQPMPTVTEVPAPPINMEVIISIAQELRTPLSVIMGYTETILNESVGILGALQGKLLKRVKANVDRLSNLVEELIKVVAIDSGQLQLAPQKINLIDIIDEAITGNRYKFSEKGIVLDLDITHEDLYVQADEEALHQIVYNLLENAYLVSPTEGVVELTARYEEDGTHIFVSISDRGGGISPEDQRRVFSRLYRADNPLISGLGDTGVGMSITKALVEAHGGNLWLESEQGVGNIFKFTLPVEQPIAEATPSVEENL